MTQRIHIFKAGRHTAMSGASLTFSETDLRRTAAAYKPSLHVAPLVLGHPKDDAPAYGSVTGLSVDGGNLMAEASVGAELTKLVRDGKYLRVSSSFYSPDAPNNPYPGTYYLRHVGFLGAMPPAVKGLEPPSFGEQPRGCVSFVESVLLTTPANALSGHLLDFAEDSESFHEAAQLMVRQTGMSYAKAVSQLDSRAQMGKGFHGMNVDPDRLRQHRAILSLQARHPELSYAEACTQVTQW